MQGGVDGSPPVVTFPSEAALTRKIDVLVEESSKSRGILEEIRDVLAKRLDDLESRIDSKPGKFGTIEIASVPPIVGEYFIENF